MPNSKRLYIVDAEVRSRAAIAFQFNQADVHVEPFEDAADFLSLSRESGTILVHDTGRSIEDLFNRLSDANVWMPAIAYAQTGAVDRIVAAVRKGALDYLVMPLELDQIMQRVQAAAALDDPLRETRQINARARRLTENLTRRETEVLKNVAQGLSNRKIAEKLGISPRTVEIHRAHMLDKLNVANSPEAVRIAMAAGIVT